MSKPEFTLNVTNRSIVVSLADNFACGGVKDQFSTEFAITSKGVDESGFVVEVVALIKAIEESYAASGRMLKASCEELAGGVIYVAHRAMGERLAAMRVTVYNLTGWVEVSWKAGDEVPAFPREATAAEVEATLEARKCNKPGARYQC